jgi:hypothetical protein
MLYGTRRGSRPALLPRVSGLTWYFVTPEGRSTSAQNLTKGIRTCALVLLNALANRGLSRP